MRGLPVSLNAFESSQVRTNLHFTGFKMPDFEKVYLPDSMLPFTDSRPLSQKEFIVDDNRGAISPSPSVSIDGIDFFLSVKGIGSTTNPFSRQLLGKAEVCGLLRDRAVRDRVLKSPDTAPRYITSELWQRYSPYGGQGLEHADIAMRASEMADVTSINGFRIAPLVKTVFFPEELEERIRSLFWYRRYAGKIVQETRLVPSNVRVYFHSGITIGGDVSGIFDMFGIDDDEKAMRFLKNFVKSGVAFLTLFSRSMKSNPDGTFSGLDFYDVWLDKDAVLSPEGTVFFVDLEGLEWITVSEQDAHEKIAHQVYRSLYEFMYAYEQLERERFSRFRGVPDRKAQLEHVLRAALKDDDIIDIERSGHRLDLVVDNVLGEQSLIEKFAFIDW
jgi:hypothetical protein